MCLSNPPQKKTSKVRSTEIRKSPQFNMIVHPNLQASQSFWRRPGKFRALSYLILSSGSEIKKGLNLQRSFVLTSEKDSGTLIPPECNGVERHRPAPPRMPQRTELSSHVCQVGVEYAFHSVIALFQPRLGDVKPRRRYIYLGLVPYA